MKAKELIKKHSSKIRFLIVGSANTIIDFGILFLLVHMGVDKYIGNYFSTSIAFVFSFFANRKYTFKSKNDVKKEIIPFLIVTLAGLWIIQPVIINFISSFNYLMKLQATALLLLAKLVATIVTLVWNYILYSKFVFKEK
jgi:putative flippase GtrA